MFISPVCITSHIYNLPIYIYKHTYHLISYIFDAAGEQRRLSQQGRDVSALLVVEVRLVELIDRGFVREG